MRFMTWPAVPFLDQVIQKLTAMMINNFQSSRTMQLHNTANSLYQLIRLNFDLVTGFSVMPLQIFSILGMLLSLAAGSLFAYLLVRRFVLGAEVEGVFTLFALTFFLIGVMLFGLGLLGEYIGRIYQQIRNRPRYVVQTVLEKK